MPNLKQFQVFVRFTGLWVCTVYILLMDFVVIFFLSWLINILIFNLLPVAQKTCINNAHTVHIFCV